MMTRSPPSHLFIIRGHIDSTHQLQYSVSQCAFTMIYVSYNRKVPDLLWGKVSQVDISDGLAVITDVAQRHSTW